MKKKSLLMMSSGKIRFKLSLCILILSFFLPNLLTAKPILIKGKITDNEGIPLIGVTVQLKGTNIGVISDVNGEYQVNASADGVLVFSYLSYIKQEIKVGQRTVINVKMQEESLLLDDVVVIGYGTQRKVDLTGAVSSVKGDAASERVVMDIGQMIAGKVPGVQVRQGSGAPGEVSSINIRGNTSLSSNSEPLYVIDGVISSASDVIPSQIESVDILKDAASTAIYGSEGANGVILITTKKGNKNNNKVELYAMLGVQSISKTLPLLNSREFAEKNYFSNLTYISAKDLENGMYPQEGSSINNISSKLVFVDDENNFYLMNPNDSYSQYYWGQQNIPANTDWQKELYKTAIIQDYRVTASGAGQGSNYSIMFGHKNQGGILTGSGYKEYSLRGNFSQKIGNKITLAFNASYLSSDRDNSMISAMALTSSPMRPIDAGIGYVEQTVPETPPANFSTNPFDVEKYTTNMILNRTATFYGMFSYDIIKGLTLRLSAAYNQTSFENQYFASNIINIAPTLNGVQYNSFSQNSIAYSQLNSVNSLRSENTLQYNVKIKQHRIGALAGYSIYTNNTIQRFMGATDFALPNLGIYGMKDGMQAMSPQYNGIDTKGISTFFRGEYSYKDRYLLKATVRADGASIFAENNKWGYFPSVALGWRITEEEWMKPIKFISNLKLRASYGVSGKQAINPYQSLPTANFTSLTVNGTDFVSGLYFNTIGNRNLKWEQTSEYNIGVDLGFLKERLSIVADIYKRRTNQLLYTDPLPGFTGYETQTQNIGSVENRGFEIGILGVPIRNRNWEWNIGLNLSSNKGKVIALGIKPDKFVDLNSLFVGAGYMKEGELLGNFYGYKTDGIWKSQAEIDDAIAKELPYVTDNVKPGYTKFVDLDENHQLTDADKTVLGNGFPVLTGGLSNSLRYKNLELNFSLLFSCGNDVYNATRMHLENIFEINQQGSADLKNAWFPNLYYWDPLTGTKGDLFRAGNPDGDIAIPQHSRRNSYGNRVPYDCYVEDASYLRLADITLSYTFPKKALTKIRIKNAKIFVTASNLFTITGYKGYDPEVNNSLGEASFLMPGLDYFSYPKARTFSAGLNVTF